MLSDLDIAGLCAAIYNDPPSGAWDHIWPTRLGFTGVKRIDDIDYVIGRATKNLFDWYVDGDFVPMDTPQIGYVHAGFYADATYEWDHLVSVLGPRAVFGGHSLAASEAALRGTLRTASGTPPERIVLFGCPRPFYQHGRDILEHARVPVQSYKVPGDPVTTVPPWTIIWPYVEPADFTMLGNYADPGDRGLLRAHHLSVYLAGLRALQTRT